MRFELLMVSARVWFMRLVFKILVIIVAVSGIHRIIDLCNMDYKGFKGFYEK